MCWGRQRKQVLLLMFARPPPALLTPSRSLFVSRDLDRERFLDRRAGAEEGAIVFKATCFIFEEMAAATSPTLLACFRAAARPATGCQIRDLSRKILLILSKTSPVCADSRLFLASLRRNLRSDEHVNGKVEGISVPRVLLVLMVATTLESPFQRGVYAYE